MASNALTLIDRREMTPAEAHAAYIDEKRDIIKRMCIPEKHLRNDALFENFIEISKLTGLNPIRKQLYCIDYGQGPNIVTGIDGLRLIAARSNAYGGGDECTFEDGPDGLPARASCTVYRIVAGTRCPFTCTVRWEEFGQRPYAAKYENNWKKMPYHMLGKVAESHALRRAFPEETSGLYTTDEMSQAHADDAPVREVRAASTPIERPERVAPLSAPRIKATAQPNGAEEAKRKIIAAAVSRGVVLDEGMTPSGMAYAIDAALVAAGAPFQVQHTPDGGVTVAALHNALMALPARAVDAETGEVLDGEAREEAPEMSADDRALYEATDQGVLLGKE